MHEGRENLEFRFFQKLPVDGKVEDSLFDVIALLELIFFEGEKRDIARRSWVLRIEDARRNALLEFFRRQLKLVAGFLSLVRL